VDQEDKERVYQSTLEFWKATFEYFKHFSAISLASIAAFAALLAGAFGAPPNAVADSILGGLVPLSNAVADSMLGGLVPLLRALPCLSLQLLEGFDDYRSLLILVAFFAFGMSGLMSLRGAHKCREALWHLRNVTNECLLTDARRYKRIWYKPIFRWRLWLQMSYTIATIAFFIIAALSIER
jgi:hypothetical protein